MRRANHINVIAASKIKTPKMLRQPEKRRIVCPNMGAIRGFGGKRTKTYAKA
jgi:hypothetical protein